MRRTPRVDTSQRGVPKDRYMRERVAQRRWSCVVANVAPLWSAGPAQAIADTPRSASWTPQRTETAKTLTSRRRAFRIVASSQAMAQRRHAKVVGCVRRKVQIGSVRERAIGTLIDRVPRMGDRIENEPYEQRHNEHVGTVRRWWSEIYETLVSGSDLHAPRKRDRKTRKFYSLPNLCYTKT